MDKRIAVLTEKIFFPRLIVKVKLRRVDRLEKQLQHLIKTKGPIEEIKKVKILIRGYKHRIQELLKERKRDEPPNFCELILLVATPKHNWDPILGDVREEYKELKTKNTELMANLWLYKQILVSVLWRIISLIPKVIWWLISALLSSYFFLLYVFL
jgi:hypothetical protein